MLVWYREMDGDGRRTFWACFLGYAIDAMDVQIVAFVLPVLIGLWSMSNSEAGLLASTTLLFSAIGGWGAGLLADRIGRVRTLQITIIWFSVFTFLSGLTNNPTQLLVVRSLQGLGFGGEWAAGSVLIGEIVAARHRGKAVGFVQSAWAVGWGLAALFSTSFLLLFPTDLAWRLLFIIGIVPAFAALMIRKLIPESAIYLQSLPHRVELASPFVIFDARYRGRTMRACMLALGIHAGYYTITIWLPTYLLTEQGLGIRAGGAYLAVIILGAFAGYLGAAYLNDWWGRRRTFLLFATAALGMVLSYMAVPVSAEIMLILGFPLGFFATGIYSGLGPVFTELYPSQLRGSGQGFCFSFGRGVAALFPASAGMLSDKLGLGLAVGLFAAAAYGLVIVAALLLPETLGKDLAGDDFV